MLAWSKNLKIEYSVPYKSVKLEFKKKVDRNNYNHIFYECLKFKCVEYIGFLPLNITISCQTIFL